MHQELNISMSFLREINGIKTNRDVHNRVSKRRIGRIDQLQGRVQFAILDQMKFMKTSSIEYNEINKIILVNVQKIIENYQSQD